MAHTTIGRQKTMRIASITRSSSASTGMSYHLSNTVHGCDSPNSNAVS